MKTPKFYFLTFFLLLAFSFSSCSLTIPVTATSNPVGSKVGTAKTNAIFGVFHPDGGDASIQTAAKNGGISKISTVDFKRNLVFLWIVISYETIVTGE
jgi:hypothetical protein